MNVKIAVIAAVAILAIAAIGGIVFYIISENNKTPASDYTLLDDNQNIRAGMNVVKSESSVNTVAEKRTVVESVIEGKVKYHQDSYSNGKTFTKLSNFYSFLPNSFYFNYTTEPPEGLTVTKSGYVYTIDGKADVTKDNYTYTMTCESLRINYNGSSVTEIFGTMTLESKPSAQAYLKEVSEYKTESGSPYVKKSTQQTLTDVIGVGTFYETVGYKFNASEFIGATLTSDSGTYAGLDVTVYTVNGSASGHSYVNFKMYVYDDQILHGEGKMDGYNAVSNLSIYIK